MRPLTLGHVIACYRDVELKFVRSPRPLHDFARNTANTFFVIPGAWPCLKNLHRLRCLKTCGLRSSAVQLQYTLKSQTSASLRPTTLKACKHPSHLSTIDSLKIQPKSPDHGKSARRLAIRQTQSKALVRKPLTKTSKAKATPCPLRAFDMPCGATQPGYSGKRLSG